jgi:hypothetical protein
MTALFQGKTPVKVNSEVIDKNSLRLVLENKKKGDMLVCMTPALKSIEGQFASTTMSAAWSLQLLENEGVDSPFVQIVFENTPP